MPRSSLADGSSNIGGPQTAANALANVLSPPTTTKIDVIPNSEFARDEAKHLAVLYLFAGPERKGGFSDRLSDLAQAQGVSASVTEIDILRDAVRHDLSSDGLWDSVFNGLRRKSWQAVLLSPPCETFSRGRSNSGGPPPLRSRKIPAGPPLAPQAL